MVWREGSLSAESRRALIKLRSLGVAADEPVIGYAPRVRVRDAAFEPLNAALGRGALVRFSYLKPGEAESRVRTVAPLALVQHQGRWHLYADEPGQPVRKTFLLRRIVSKVETTGTTFELPEGDLSAIALHELEEIWNGNTAVVEVAPGSDAATRLHKRRGTVETGPSTLELHFSDANILADELAGFGPEVLVIAPESLRDAVRARLEQTEADHG